jgi:hypothetical protein
LTSFSPIVTDTEAAHGFDTDASGLSFEGAEGDDVFAERLGGVKHFGLWPLAEATQACFGDSEWSPAVPAPVPQASVEFEAADVAAAARELEDRRCRLLHGPKVEPWGQETGRLLSPEGLVIAVCRTPWLHGGERGRHRTEPFGPRTGAADGGAASGVHETPRPPS